MTLMEMWSYFQGPSGELLKKVIDYFLKQQF